MSRLRILTRPAINSRHVVVSINNTFIISRLIKHSFCTLALCPIMSDMAVIILTGEGRKLL